MPKRRKRKVSALRLKFTKKMQEKLVLLYLAILLAFVVLIGRVVQINAVSGEDYTKTVLDQQQYSSTVIPFKRGDIVDTNGTKLATSERVYNVILDVKTLLDADEDSGEYVRATKEALTTYLEIDEATIDNLIVEKPDSRYCVLKKGISYDDAQAYNIGIKENSYVQGVWLEEDYVRKYPYNSLACDVIGFSVDGNIGASGLEAYYNSVLNGTDGRKYGYQTGTSDVEQTVKMPINGNTIVSTLDTNLQSIVEKHILAFNEEYKNHVTAGDGAKNIAVMVMNPNTGEILAMASYPDFDLNNPRDLSKYYTDAAIEEKAKEDHPDYANYTDEEWSKAVNETKLQLLNALWRNFCVSDAFEPGSTLKPFTVATGLEIGTLDGSETYYCNGSLQVADTPIKCIAYDRGGHGTQTLSQVLENSCNVALMEIAAEIGAEEFTKYQSIFGFGEYTGLDLPGNASGILYSAEDMGSVDLATNSFGQNFTVTMVQVAAAFSSLVNGGDYYTPHIVKEIRDESGNVVETIEPVLENRTISEETSEILKSYMYNVVQNGSGKLAAVEGYDIGGKTGTAEKLPRGQNKNLISFIGYAPQENPEVVVYVVIDEPNVENQGLSNSLVTTLSNEIMAEAFPYLGITKTQTE